jgi:hypothetical protein
MTLDKFGRHLMKNSQPIKANIESETLKTSKYMFYNQILTFHANKVLDNKYMIVPGQTSYLFPLESGIIENVRVNSDDVSLNINGTPLTTEQAYNFPVKFNYEISFDLKEKLENNSNTMNQNLFAEIIVKCPIKFETDSVSLETPFVAEWVEERKR